MFRLLMIWVGIAFVVSANAQESGYQTIQGTRVFTQIDHASATATFSNACGSQTLTQSQLASGAIPNDIIPCPRTEAGSPPANRSCPEGKVSTSSGECMPESAHDCGNGNYCAEHMMCSKSGDRCLPEGSKECSAGGFCSEDEVCLVGGGCLARTSPRVCSDGENYCPENRKCAQASNTCLHLDAEECGNGKFCTGGKVCDLAHASCRERTDADSKTIALVTTARGDFFGTSVSDDATTAASRARELCQAQRANTASTPDERDEACNMLATNVGKCLALVRSHDFIYGAPDAYHMGLGAGATKYDATEQAMRICRIAGGKSCFVVTESVACADGS